MMTLFARSHIPAFSILRVAIAGALALAAIYILLGWMNVQLTFQYGRIAAVWLPNAMLLAILLRTRAAWPDMYLGIAFVANVLLNLAFGDDLSTALLLGIGNFVEVALTLWVVRRFYGQNPDIAEPRMLNILLGISIAMPAISAVFPGLALASPGSWFDQESAIKWYSAHALAMATVVPTMLILIDGWRARKRPSAQDLIDWSKLIVGTVLVAAAIFGQTSYPLLFLACPLVLVAAFRTGLLGTAVSIVIVSVIASAATLQGSGPIMLVDGDLGYKLATLQLFLVTCFMIGLPVATVLQGRASIAAELLESRNLFDQVLQNMGEVVFKTNARGEWLFLNSAWVNMTGYSVDESLGWSTSRLLVEEDKIASLADYGRLVGGHIDSMTLHQRFVHRDGSIRHIEVMVRRLGDEHGNFTGTIGNIRDVTDTIAQQRALIESDRRFQALADLAPVGIFRTEVDGGCSYANRAWENMAGIANGRWRGTGWSSAMHPDDLDRVAQGWGSAVANRTEYEGEFRWLHEDGAVTWVSVMCAPESDMDGNYVGYIGVTIDITERKTSEAELALRQQELTTLANNVTDAVMRLSLDGICLYASPSCGKLLDIPPEQLVGQNVMTGFHPDDEDRVQQALGDMMAGQMEELIIAYRAEDRTDRGSYAWLEANCGLVRGQDGTPAEVIASIRNVTMTKQMEQDLREARRKAEHAARAKTAFLANMSHEIRTPMNGVIGFTELVLAGELESDQRRKVELIADSGRAMMLLLNDILDMAKIEAGQMDVVEEPVNIVRQLHVTSELMAGAAASKGLDIHLDIPGDLPEWIVGDTLRLRQILLNLLGNATKFTEQGSIAIAARVAGSHDGDMLEIAVKDSGIGIAESRLQRIFDQFAQADSGIARKFGGTGLGLAISASLAKKMGGTINVESEPDVGSTFTLRIPLTPCAAPKQGADKSFDNQAPTPASDQIGRVLVAEDHDINQELMRQMADRANIAIEIARDGQEAIEMVEAAQQAGTPFAMVLMDMQMPRLDGLSATRALRAKGFDAATLPIFALTANAFSEDIDACRDAGMQGHLTKPLRTRDFVATVRRWGGVRGETAAAPATSRKKSLRERYADRKKEALEIFSRALRENRIDDAAIDELADQLHKISGTAGFFGEADLGEQARDYEERLKKAAPDKRTDMIAEAAALLDNAA